jgi:hypothetical protein
MADPRVDKDERLSAAFTVCPEPGRQYYTAEDISIGLSDMLVPADLADEPSL